MAQLRKDKVGLCYAVFSTANEALQLEALSDGPSSEFETASRWFRDLDSQRRKEVFETFQSCAKLGESVREWRIGQRCESVRLVFLEGRVPARALLYVNLSENGAEIESSDGVERCEDCAMLVASLKASQFPFCYKDSDLRYLGCNYAFEELFHVDEKSIVGKTVEEVFGAAGVFDEETDREAINAESEISYRSVAVVRTHDLVDLHVLKKSFSLDSRFGNRKGLVCTYLDSTDETRLRSQLNQTREVLDNTLDICLLIDWQLMATIEVNTSASTLLGYSKEELISMNPLQLFPQLQEKHILEASKKREGSVKNFKTLVMKKNGEVFDVEMLIKPVEDASKQRCIAILRDISTQLRVEDELKSANHTLRIVGSIMRTIISAETEMELLEGVCHKIVNTDNISSAFVVVENEYNPDINLIYGHGFDSLGLCKLLAEFEVTANKVNDWLTNDVNEEVLLISKPKMFVEAGGIPKWMLPRNGACMSFPLKKGDKAQGRLILFSRNDNAFKEDERVLYRQFVQEIQYAFDNLRSREGKKAAEVDIARRLRVEAAMSRFSSNLLGYSNFEEGVQHALPILLKVVSAENVFIFENEYEDDRSVGASKICEFIKPGLLRSVSEQLRYDEFNPDWIESLENNETVEIDSHIDNADTLELFGVGKRNRLLLFPFFSGKRWAGIAGFDLPCNKKNRYGAPKEILIVAINLIGELYARCEADKQMKLLATAINSSDEGVFIARNVGGYFDSKIIFASGGLCRLTGYEPSSLIGNTPKAFKGSNQLNEGDNHLIAALERNESYVGQSNYRKSNGEVVLVERVVYPIFNETGACANYLAIQRDITEKKAMESRLEFANKMEAVGQLSAGIAHEINTPSQFIGDNLQYLKNAWDQIQPILEKLSEGEDFDAFAKSSGVLRMNQRRMGKLVKDVPEAICDAKEGAERISTIVGAMREFSHPEKNMTFSDINKSIETTVTVARNEWKYVSDLELELDEAMPLIKFQAGDINQVILNLIVNAAHSIAERNEVTNEKGKIVIRSCRVNDFARVSISDTGCGIPLDVRPSIFDPFFTTKEVGVGTGQGLFIAHSIVEQKHEGRLWFESEVGEGTTFYLELPIEEDAGDAVIC